MKQALRRLYPSGLQRVTPCPRVLRWKDLASSHRIKLLPGRGSNPRLPVNGRMSCRSTTWHRCTATGNRTPLPGLRARCRDLWTIAACRAGAGRLERPKARTSTCFRDRLLIRPDHSQDRHTEPSVGFAPTASSLPRTRSTRLSYKGRCLAGTTRTCDLRLRRAVLWVLLSYGEVASTAGLEPAFSGFVDRRLDPFGHVDMTAQGAGRRRRDLHPSLSVGLPADDEGPAGIGGFTSS